MIVSPTDKNGKVKTDKQMLSVIANMLDKRTGRLRFLQNKISLLQAEADCLSDQILQLEYQKRDIEEG